MATKPLYIFDLDGTLADIEHRLHYIKGPKKDWKSFFAACPDDTPIESTLKTLTALRKGGAEVWVWTGRSEEVRTETLSWLQKHQVFQSIWNPLRAPEALLMREHNDFRPDHRIKEEWLHRLDPPERNRLIAVFDDRQAVVDMWRMNNVQCFQVAPGEF